MGISARWGCSIALAAALTPIATAAAADPLDIQGLELADGTIAAPPHPPVWGEALDPMVRRDAERRLGSLRHELGPIWVSWDPHRDAVRGIITSGVPAPGTAASAAVAEAFARDFLRRHLDVLAPGASLGDFVLVANHASAGIRSLGFAQLHAGRVVLGGQLSFRFKADSLAYVASQAWPNVRVTGGSASAIDDATARARARDFVADDWGPASLSVTGPVERLVLPVFSGGAWSGGAWSGGAWTYHDVLRVEVRARDPLGQWWVYLDAGTGRALAREQRIRTAATVTFDAVTRHPGDVRYDALVPGLDVTETGMAAITDAVGAIALTASPTTLDLGVDGPLVDVVNDAGPDASSSWPVADGETVLWSAAADEQGDAQLNAFVHTSLVKAFVRDLDPTLTWLDQQVQATVNVAGACNAGSNGDDIYFLSANGSCENTARIADVVYHEIGHSVHSQSVIPGVGAFESSLSEGVSDYLAATIVDDSGMARGFYYTDEPLRELDPVGSEWTWPDDIGEAHATGRIIGGTLWDLRTSLMGTLGADPGRAHADRIYYEAHRRATDIPSMYPEALLYDDDDGNLANGTPNGCEINAVFEAHGLLDPGELGELQVAESAVPGGRAITLTPAIPVFAGCPVILDAATLSWRVRETPETINEVPMVPAGGGWVATIPTHDTGTVVEYQIQSTFSNGTDAIRPHNPADPWYQTYFGAVLPIYCLDDMADLGAWTFGGPGDHWSFGPLMPGSGLDPTEPWDADGVLLSQDGTYDPNSNTWAMGPVIPLPAVGDVRLQYRRWLTVEDGFYDHARIDVNGQPLWENLATPITTVHHVDREWRFHDLPLDAFLAEGQVQLTFELQSDVGLHMGGWTADALCIVEVVDEVCGDDQVTGTEECDDGNLVDGDGCDAQCLTEQPPDPPTTTGDTGGDSTTGGGGGGGGTTGGPDGTTGGSLPPGDGTSGGGDGPDAGTTGDTDGDPDASAEDGGCGCTSKPRRGVAWWLLLAGVGLLRRRRSSTVTVDRV